MKQTQVIFSEDAEEVYEYLTQKANSSKIERTILRAIDVKVELIKKNIHYGNAIAKRLIPTKYRMKYGITNLYRVELPMFWRMLYTITEEGNSVEIIAFVLDVVDHKEYNRLFGYKKK